MTPMLNVVDQSAARAERELATGTGAARQSDGPSTVVHAETPKAARAIEEALRANGISFIRSLEGTRMLFKVHPAAYSDAKTALLANLKQLRERAPISDFCFYFNEAVDEKRSAA